MVLRTPAKKTFYLKDHLKSCTLCSRISCTLYSRINCTVWSRILSSNEFYRFPGNKQPDNVNTYTPSSKTETNYGVKTSSGKSIDSLQDEIPHNETADLLPTTHLGYYYKQLPESNYNVRFIGTSGSNPIILKNLFYRTIELHIGSAVLGKISKNNEDVWVIMKKDTLSLDLHLSSTVTVNLKHKLLNYTGSGEYILSLQVENSDGHEYYSESFDRKIDNVNKDAFSASYFHVLMKINPEKLSLFPTSQDLYLNFFVDGKKEKKSMLEGFVKFRVE